MHSDKKFTCRNNITLYTLLKINYNQARVQEFVRGPQNLKACFFFGCSIFQGGGRAQKIDDKMIFSTKKVVKYWWNSLNFALMTFFFGFSISRGGPRPLGSPPLDTRLIITTHMASQCCQLGSFRMREILFF